MTIQFNNVSVIYNRKSPFEYQALKDIDTTFEPGKFYGLIGHTGSGKSTLIQTMNGLILPSSGTVETDGIVLSKKVKQKTVHQAKSRVGMVFQFPEHQLFESTVLKDVMFGPMNMGIGEEEAKEKACYYLKLLNVDDSLLGKSPFELSGGQMRKVAIAGILAMEPSILILDEPTAGLDPLSHDETMQLFYDVYKKMGITVILITHDMNDVLEYADEVKVMSQGMLAGEGPTCDVLTDKDFMERYNLEVPHVIQLVQDLTKKGIVLNGTPKNTAEFIQLYEDWRRDNA
ncbi:Energy-coupling factor transporter ATP-binding protein EcfA2 [Jeotgalicoccus saudimassiliensis]|uniref:Energy-coupling factor transporter ATP-binding protein EcfA2 n=1 Tax=Jeotgalicoccus saudimassiliensis TaxID=1461582 RepID=A0A078M7L0_9STAP|nr:energy-coupling factor transporter ATPase [Jeotgalicoccus saudimassiliensis]CEA01362.1 Energy-coupling factor transporter ATP-binding protein EcfA2 [Jeotgalicoccus saudimassiliensis]